MTQLTVAITVGLYPSCSIFKYLALLHFLRKKHLNLISGLDAFMSFKNFYPYIYITPAVKYRRFCLPKFSPASLLPIVVVIAATHSPALQPNIYSA